MELTEDEIIEKYGKHCIAIDIHYFHTNMNLLVLFAVTT